MPESSHSSSRAGNRRPYSSIVAGDHGSGLRFSQAVCSDFHWVNIVEGSESANRQVKKKGLPGCCRSGSMRS